ncbi:MAG: hypothetical protein Kow00107_04570 [Planctomycetota bacterium]
MKKVVRKHRWLTALKESRLAAGYTLENVASELGITCSALSRIESGERSLELSMFERMCSIYSVTPESVFDGKAAYGEFSPSRQEPGSRMRALRKSAGFTLNDLAGKLGVAQSTLSLIETGHRRLTMKFLERFLLCVNQQPGSFFRGFDRQMFVERPIVGAAAAGQAGTSEIFGATEGGDTVLGPELRYRDVTTLEIEGDSMYPYYRPGDIVYCTSELEANSGEIAVVRMTDESVVCKVIFRKDNGLLLRSINPEWEDRLVPYDEVVSIWPVVASLRKEKGRRI